MKAAYIERFGPAEEIHYGDFPPPQVGPQDVLVRAGAVCVDLIDTYIRAGLVSAGAPLPLVVGRDLAGVVERVGPAVTGFSIGERVWCNNQGHHGRQGTFADLVSVREDLLYRMPAGADPLQVVALVHSGLTACLGLRRSRLKTGDTIWVGGGSGNVGSAVLQLARARGARTIATAGSADGLGWCRELGADLVLDYHRHDLDHCVEAFCPGGVDVYWDTSGHADFDSAVRRTAERGRIVVMAGVQARVPLPVGPFYVKQLAMHGFAVTYAAEQELAESAEEINRWIATGSSRVRVDRVLPLSQTAAAHRLVESGTRLRGKIVLVP